MPIVVAQSIAGLTQQLVQGGYDRDALMAVRGAYDLSRRLVSGLHLGDGRPFLNHMVGLASMLHRYDQPPTVVIAGLLHSIYTQGDFGPLCSFPRAQAAIRRQVGASVEAHVHRFHVLSWNTKGIAEHLRDLASYDPIGRACLVMRLANEVEHLVDGAALHRTNGERYVASRVERLPTYVALAEELGVPAIARDLEAVLATVQTLAVPDFMREPGRAAARITSESYGPRPLATIGARLDALLPTSGRAGAFRDRLWPRRG